MALDAIAGLEVPAADDGCLLLWVPAQLNRRGVGVATAEAWGYRVTGEIVWDKPNLGFGTVPRACHEVLLLAVRGRWVIDGPRNIRSVQRWPQAYTDHGGKRHSAKPEAALDLAELIGPPPRLEMFSRRARLGWDTWGEEALMGTGHPLAATLSPPPPQDSSAPPQADD